MSRVLTLMQALPPKLAKLPYLCRCLPQQCYILVLSLLLFGVGFGLNLASFWGCLKLISCVLVCFIRSFEPFRMKSSMFFIYPFIELLKIQSMNQHSSFSSYCHISVCAIIKEVIQVSERFLLALRGSWWVISLFFTRSLLVPHVVPIPIVHWMIIQPPIFTNLYLWVEPKNIIMLLELFCPWHQLFPQRTSLQLCISCTLSITPCPSTYF
jgi:hypothetical protein